MLEIKERKFIFKIKKILFSDYPFDVNDCHMVIFRDCKNKVDVDGFEREEFTTLVIDLTQDLDKIWKDITDSSRNAINQARRLGVKIKINDNYKEFYEMNRLFRKCKGLPRLDMEINLMKKYGTLFVAEYEGEIIAGYFCLQDESNMCALLAASKRLEVDKAKAALIGKASKLIIWEAISYAKSKGIKEFDWEGYHTGKIRDEQKAKINTTKERIGGKLVTHYIYYKSYSRFCKYAKKLYHLRLRGESYFSRLKLFRKRLKC